MFDACICAIYDEFTILLARRRLKSRKEHKCIECKCTIQPGDIYERDVTLFEKEFETFKTCLVCVRIRESLFSCDWCYGRMWDDIHEILCGPEDGECICP